MTTIPFRIALALVLLGATATAGSAAPLSPPVPVRPAPRAGNPEGSPVEAPAPGPARPVEPETAARDQWTRVAPGIRHLHRTTAEPLSVHVMEVDLRAPGVSIEVTPHEQRWMTTSQFGRASGAVAAVNGGFWSVFDAKAEGLVMHGGRAWPGARDDEFYGFFAVTREGKAEISPALEVVRKGSARLLEAVSGLQRILHLGKVTREAFCDDGCRFRHPRTVVGVSADGHRVLLAVVDGRQPHSRGISLSALAQLLAGLGASEAINLDGGGSAALYLATAKGLVSRPADRRERGVLNHVGVFWRPTRAQLADWRAEQARLAAEASALRPGARPAGPASGRGATEPPAPGGALAAPPRPSQAGVPTGLARFLQRHFREWLSPRNLLLLVPLFALLAALVLLRGRRRPASPPHRLPGALPEDRPADR